MNEAGKWLEERSIADTWPGIALLFLLFGYFFLASLGYGAFLARLWRNRESLLESVSDAFLFATAFLWCAATILASVHGLGWFPPWVYWLVFLPGLAGVLPLLRELFRSAQRRHAYYLALFIFIFFLRALSASLPSRHGDALLYHLLGPRLWMEAGGFIMHPQLPNALLAASWEILYLWPQMFFFSARPLFGLVEAQLFSQWIHIFFAWAGCALLTMRLFQPYLRPLFLPTVGLAALFVSGLHWTAPLAKNDVGVAFWALGALVYLVEAFRKKSNPLAWLSGLFAGLALSGKITALFTLGPLGLACLLAAAPWRQWRFLFSFSPLWLLGFFAGAGPLWARNYILSGNPFFPLFSKIFPSPFISPTWESHFAQVHPSNPFRAFSRLWLRVPELWKESPFILVALALLAGAAVSLWRGREKEQNLAFASLTGGAFLAYAAFVLTQAPEIELRYLGASLMILAGAGVVVWERVTQRISSMKFRQAAFGVLLVAILATSKLPLHLLGKIWKEPLGVAYISSHTAGEAKGWLRKNAAGEFTVMAGDNESYYLTPVAHAVLTERPDLDAATLEEKDFARFVATVCEKSGAKYFFDARPQIGMEAKFGARIPAGAKVFSAQGANIYDLGKIERSVAPGSKRCP